MFVPYNLSFTCGHTQSYGARNNPEFCISNMPTPCIQCDPTTVIAKALIEELKYTRGLAYIMASGGMVVSDFPVRDAVRMVSIRSKEGIIVNINTNDGSSKEEKEVEREEKKAVRVEKTRERFGSSDGVLRNMK